MVTSWPLVGRQHELDVITAALQEALDRLELLEHRVHQLEAK